MGADNPARYDKKCIVCNYIDIFYYLVCHVHTIFELFTTQNNSIFFLFKLPPAKKPTSPTYLVLDLLFYHFISKYVLYSFIATLWTIDNDEVSGTQISNILFKCRLYRIDIGTVCFNLLTQYFELLTKKNRNVKQIHYYI